MDIQKIVELLSQNKAENIERHSCDSYITPNVIIATALNGTHSYALSERIVQFVKEYESFCLIDGDAKDGWVVVDIPFLDLMVHLMTNEKREYYNLEEILSKNLKNKV